MYFLVVPAAVSNANNEAQKTITDIGNQLDTKTSRIQELETQMQALQTENDTLNQELQGYVGTDGTLQTIDSLLAAATTYLETQDITQTAANLKAFRHPWMWTVLRSIPEAVQDVAWPDRAAAVRTVL